MNRAKHLFKTAKWPGDFLRTSGNISAIPCQGSEWGSIADFKDDPSSDMIREFAKKLLEKTDENSELRDIVQQQGERLEKLEQFVKEIFDPSDIPPYGPFEHWIASEKNIAPYRGKHIAYVANRGVIAFSDSLDDLVEQVKKMGKVEGVIIDIIPIASPLI